MEKQRERLLLGGAALLGLILLAPYLGVFGGGSDESVEETNVREPARQVYFEERYEDYTPPAREAPRDASPQDTFTEIEALLERSR